MVARGWKYYSNYYSINHGHFRHNAYSYFNVTIFDLSAAKIEYPTAKIESDASIDTSDVKKNSSENMSHGPLLQEEIINRQEGEANNDNFQTNVIEVEVF